MFPFTVLLIHIVLEKMLSEWSVTLEVCSPFPPASLSLLAMSEMMFPH